MVDSFVQEERVSVCDFESQFSSLYCYAKVEKCKEEIENRTIRTASRNFMPSAASLSELEALSIRARSSSSFGCVSKNREVLNEMRSMILCVDDCDIDCRVRALQPRQENAI
jgi:hypothetical protein